MKKSSYFNFVLYLKFVKSYITLLVSCEVKL